MPNTFLYASQTRMYSCIILPSAVYLGTTSQNIRRSFFSSWSKVGIANLQRRIYKMMLAMFKQSNDRKLVCSTKLSEN